MHGHNLEIYAVAKIQGSSFVVLCRYILIMECLCFKSMVAADKFGPAAG